MNHASPARNLCNLWREQAVSGLRGMTYYKSLRHKDLWQREPLKHRQNRHQSSPPHPIVLGSLFLEMKRSVTRRGAGSRAAVSMSANVRICPDLSHQKTS